MQLRELLRGGELGLQLELPPRHRVVEETERMVNLVDEEWGLNWFFLFAEVTLNLSPAHRSDLASALEWYGRAMFDTVFRQLPRPPGGGAAKPRTDDAGWATMVDVEHLLVDGAAALRTVHRMSYQPGHEMIMAHLLVPLRRGLFEARVIAIDNVTGLRESVLVSERLAQLGPEDDVETALGSIRQSEHDDPGRDALFPAHALSRARAGIQRLCAPESGLRVLDPATKVPGGEVELPRLCAALVPPPRFVLDPAAAADDEQAVFARVSFCTTDGMESLVVRRVDELGRLSPDQLRSRAEVTTRQLQVDGGVGNVQLEVDELAPREGRPELQIIAEGDGHAGRLRNSFRWFLDEGGRAWYLSVAATAAVPATTRAAELAAAAQTFRLTSPPPPTPATAKPWWKVW